MWGDFALTALTLVDASLPPIPPTLQISLVSSKAAQLYWPTNSTGFTIQQNTDLGTTNWISMTNVVNVVGTNNQVRLSPLIGNVFFRLVHH